jgi:hypothetical protein
MKPHLHLFAAVIGLLPLLPAVAQAREEIVQFAKGSSGATLKGKIKGWETGDYKLKAGEAGWQLKYDQMVEY